MKRYLRLVSVLSTGVLFGCSQWSLAPVSREVAGAREARPGQVAPALSGAAISGAIAQADVLFESGKTAYHSGQLALAEERYARLLQHAPSHLGALNAMAVLYAQSDRLDAALVLFKRALEIAPQASHLHNNLGYALLQAGRLADAQTSLQQALSLDPSSTRTRLNFELLARSKEQALSAAVHAVGPSPVEGVAASHQLVAVQPNVYELRDHHTGVGIANGLPGQTLVSDPTLRGVRMEVSNGVGIRHLARRTAEKLAPTGVVTARLTNQPRFQQTRTELQYGVGQDRAANLLATKLPVAVRVVPSARLGTAIQMRLVLGHDIAGKAMVAWIDSPREGVRVAWADSAGWR